MASILRAAARSEIARGSARYRGGNRTRPRFPPSFAPRSLNRRDQAVPPAIAVEQSTRAATNRTVAEDIPTIAVFMIPPFSVVRFGRPWTVSLSGAGARQYVSGRANKEPG